jgi:hypothetical protein
MTERAASRGVPVRRALGTRAGPIRGALGCALALGVTLAASGAGAAAHGVAARAAARTADSGGRAARAADSGGRAARAVPSSSAAGEARAIDLTVGDLPSSIKWASAPQAGSNKAETAAGKTAAKCLQRLGAATDDAYGTTGVSGGTVLADVKSPQFSDKADTFTQLPAANSEVVIVASAKDATSDLAAVAKKGALDCFGAQYQVDVVQSGSGKARVTEHFAAAPHHGSGNGGVHVQFVATGGLLPQKLYNDEYFYAVGTAEVVLSFLNLGSPFDVGWADQAITKVMQRAAAQAR